MKIEVNKLLNYIISYFLGVVVEMLYFNVKLGFGFVIDEGFYYDFDFVEVLSENELGKIEKLMKKLVSRNLVIIKISEDEYDFVNKFYKKELYDELKF